MKKIVYFILSLIIAFTFTIVNGGKVYAASYSVSVNTSNVSAGGSVTLSITGSGCEGSFSVSVNNGASVTGNNPIWTGESTQIKAGSSSFAITVMPQSVSDSSTAEMITSSLGSKSIPITVKSASSNSGNSSSSSGSSNSSSSASSSSSSSNVSTTSQEPEEKKSSEKNLSSLSVSEGTLSPKFSAGTTTYKVDLTSDVEKLTISAKAKDSKAKVSGTGEKELKIGENNFTVTVTAEDGSKKTYTISVYVTEKPTQFVKLGDQSLGILNDLSKVDVPKGFEKTTIKIDDKDVTALQNKDLGLTLLYLQTEDEKTGFYIYDVDNNKVLRQYQTLTVNGKTYVIMDAPENLEEVQGLEKSTIKIGDLEMNGWKFNEETLSHYTLVYLMNDAGESGLYTYEDTEGTLQKYTPVEEKDNTLTYVFIGTTVVFALSTAVVGYMYFNFKKKSISAIKDYYDKKNQG